MRTYGTHDRNTNLEKMKRRGIDIRIWYMMKESKGKVAKTPMKHQTRRTPNLKTSEEDEEFINPKKEAQDVTQSKIKEYLDHAISKENEVKSQMNSITCDW